MLHSLTHLSQLPLAVEGILTQHNERALDGPGEQLLTSRPILQGSPGATETHVVALLAIVLLMLLGTVLWIGRRRPSNRPTTPDRSSQSESVLSDRDRVYAMLQENGGRMRQSAIVDSVDWSKAKVSRLLADLEEDDEITKLRLGRENLVCLRGHEPQVSQSPEQSPEVH